MFIRTSSPEVRRKFDTIWGNETLSVEERCDEMEKLANQFLNAQQVILLYVLSIFSASNLACIKFKFGLYQIWPVFWPLSNCTISPFKKFKLVFGIQCN